jgi:hypothetical protein
MRKTKVVWRLAAALLFVLGTLYMGCEDASSVPDNEQEGGMDFHQWALTPPMGWNSWDCYGANVTESEVRENADYLAANLKQYGWEYIVVDIRWFVSNQSSGDYNQSNPVYVLDEYGRYLPAENRFPSAAEGAGFKPLADYIHDKGLKFGIHIMRGVPKKAVQDKLPIKGTAGITADTIYSTALQCTWLKDNYTILADRLGAQEYYDSIFELYASWGVDFIKIDDLSRPYHKEEIELIRKAIDKTQRPIVLSLSPGETPLTEAEHVQKHANMWRMVDDFWDTWAHVTHEFEICVNWAPYIASGTWPDADMLPFGRINLRGLQSGGARMTKFTQDEQYTVMSLFSILKSPLMFGGNLPDNDAFTNSLLTNEEVLYMHNTSSNNRELFNRAGTIAWTADDSGGDKYLALFFMGGGDGNFKSSEALYRSGIISRTTTGHGEEISVPLKGATDLYLVVSDGGDDFVCDWADWIDPRVTKEDGDTLYLTDLNWVSATSGWNSPQKNKSVEGGTLRIDGTPYTRGIGTHAESVIRFNIPAGYTRFEAFVGLDTGGTSQSYSGATVKFMVFDTNPIPQAGDTPESQNIPFDMSDLGFSGEVTVRDLWKKEDLGAFSGTSFAPKLNVHGVGLYRITASKN